ncbi:putative reverse transcriptase domain-containing protein, partial [Tanacetum coccineum]
MGSLAPTRADLLPLHKRFRDSYSSEASIEEDAKIDPIETEVDIELGIGDGDDVRDNVEIDPRDVGIDPMSAPIVEEDILEPAGEDSSDSSGTRDGILASMIERIDSLRLKNLKVHAMLDIKMVRVNSLRLHMSLSQEEFCQVRRDRDDTRGRLRRTITNTHSGTTPVAIEEMINQRVDAALEAHRVNRDLELDNGNGNGNGNGNDNGNGNGNGTGNGNNGGDNNDGNENRNVNGRGYRPVARECTYQDFMKFQPLSFKGTEGVRTIRTDVAYALSWRELLKLMIEVYCPRNEIQKMETELWNLSVKKNDMATYTQRFQELTMMYTKMVPEEEDRVDNFIAGLPDNIQRNVIVAELTILQDAVRIANNLIDQKLKGYANTGGQNVARAYMAGNNEKNGYEGTLSFCNRCKLHHEGQCTAKCHNCKRVRHLAKDCRSVVTVTTQGTPRQNQGVVTCFECTIQGHYQKDCPIVKNQNRRNKARVPDARGKTYVLGG